MYQHQFLLSDYCKTMNANNTYISNILDAVRHWAHLTPKKYSFLYLDANNNISTSVTFQELLNNSLTVAKCINNIVPKNQVVLILLQNDEYFLYSFYGTLFSHSLPTILNVYSRDLKSHIDNIIGDIGSNYILTTKQIYKRIESRIDIEQCNILFVDEFVGKKYRDIELKSDKDIAFLQYTSGSTSAPKGIAISHENLYANSKNIQEHFGHTPQTIGLSWLPIHHDLGLVGGIIQPVFCGFTVYIMSPANFISKPIRWLEAISKYKVNTTSGPNFAFDLCVQKSDQLDNINLSSWDVACIGGDMVHKETLIAFEEKFSKYGFKKSAFMPCYGMAESTLFVSGAMKHKNPSFVSMSRLHGNETEGYHIANIADYVGCGQPSGLDLRIVDKDNRPLSPLQIGEIWISGNSVSKGFWNYETEDNKYFRMKLADDSEKYYFRTGDLGFLDENGELFIVGRIKEVIILNGVNYSPSDIEKSAQNEYVDCLVTGRGATFLNTENRLVLIQEIRRDKIYNVDFYNLADSIKTIIFQKSGLALNELMFVKQGKVPITSSGKVKRTLCKNIYPKLDGVLAKYTWPTFIQT